MKKLTDLQFDEVVEQYADIVLDRMDYKDLEQYVYDSLTDYYEKCSDVELKEEVDNYDEDLFDELVDNVTNETVLDVNNTGGKY